MRPSRRQPDELRPVSLERGVVKFAEGSCFVRFGDTHVLVTATPAHTPQEIAAIWSRKTCCSIICRAFIQERQS